MQQVAVERGTLVEALQRFDTAEVSLTEAHDMS